VSAAFNPFPQDVCGSSSASNSSTCKTNGSDPITGRNGVLYKVSRAVALIAGIAAVIVIIVGGFMYITAGGDAGRAKNARSMIIGAIIGLIVIVLAEAFIALIINLVH
jgi:hypothetical protein